MAVRIAFLFFPILAATVFGQDPAPVKAGDRAPNLTWEKIVRTGKALGGPQSLFGQTTVLLFLRPVSQNEQSVAEWNKLVEQFADKPVNFVWIANEKEETLQPWLKTHPVSGWMVLDPKEDSYRAYGIEGAGGVFINPKGDIAGFSFFLPDARQLQAVLDGKAIPIKGEPTDQQKDLMFASGSVRVDAEAQRMASPVASQKPDIPPSEDVHISPSPKQTQGTEASAGPDYWVKRGFDLRTIIAEVSQTDSSRVELPASLDNATRYDFALLLAREEDPETMYRFVKEGIEKYFKVTITRAIRPKDVYIMSAIEGKTPPKRPEGEEFGGGLKLISSDSYSTEIAFPEGTTPSREALEAAAALQLEAMKAFPTISAISATNSTIGEFRKALEEGLKRPIVDETKLTGVFDFTMKGEARTDEEFLAMIRDQFGLVLTPTQRSIEVVLVQMAR